MATRLNFSLNSYHNNKSQREREYLMDMVFMLKSVGIRFFFLFLKKTIIASVLNMTQNFIFYFEKITWRF